MTEMLNKRPDSLGLGKLLADDDYHDCPCGTGERYWGEGSGARTRHANWHLEWDRGVAIPSSVFWFDSLAVVNGESPRKDQEVAHKLGRLFQREQHYDFPMAPDARSWRGNPSEVLIAQYRHIAIGAVFTYPTLRYGAFHAPDADGYIRFSVELMEPQPKIAGIWVARGWRRRGVATVLLLALSERADIALGDLIWALPFSDAGRPLAQSIGGAGLRVCS